MWHDIRDALWKLPACLGAILLLGVIVLLTPYLLALLLGVALMKAAVRGIRWLGGRVAERVPLRRFVLAPLYRLYLWFVSDLGICPIREDSLVFGNKGGDHASFDLRPALQADGCHCPAR